MVPTNQGATEKTSISTGLKSGILGESNVQKGAGAGRVGVMSRGVDAHGRTKPIRKRFGSYEGIKETTKLADTSARPAAVKKKSTMRMKSQGGNGSDSQDEDE